MPAIVLLGNISLGHSCWPPRPNDSASSNVYVNNIAVHRLGDHWIIHSCSGFNPHDGFMSEGSPNVFVNGLAVARIGDAISCGDHAAEGSPNVFAN